MMKIQTYGKAIAFMLLTLLAVWMTACSSDDDTNGQPEVDILSRFNNEGKAWMSLQIPLGSQMATRANDFGFDDGLDGEWKVKDAYILIFAGASESAAKFASAYKVESPTLNTSAYEQITATVTFPINDANINTGDKLYVFALLNNNSSAITSFAANSITFANGGSEKIINSSSTLSDLKAVTISSFKDNNDYFLMTNATLADAPSANASLSILVEMPASYFFPTEALAEAHPAGHIFVERLAAKATVVVDRLTNHYVLGNEYATFVNEDLMFALDNYNTSSYACQLLNGVTYGRFVESKAVEPYYPLRYRIYWAEDANYDGKNGLIYKDHANKDQIPWSALGNDSPQYCAENTFNVANMKDDCTTSVLVRLQLNKGGDFYTTSVTGSDIVFQPPGQELEEQGTSASSSFSRTRSNKVPYSGGENYATIDEYLRQWLMETNSDFREWVNKYAAGEVKHVEIKLTNDASTGTATVGDVTQTARTSGAGATAFEVLNLRSYFANNIALKFYENGYCYYRVLIRHFDDTLTPWASAALMTDNTTATVYSGDAASYLGRYGVVRNNWYNISINSITHIGSPIIPALTTNADDKVEQLLNATLHISGWEGHEQNL